MTKKKLTSTADVDAAKRLAFMMMVRQFETLNKIREEDEDWGVHELDATVDMAITAAAERLTAMQSATYADIEKFSLDWLHVWSIVHLARLSFGRTDTHYSRTLDSIDSALLVLDEMIQLTGLESQK